MKCIFSVDVEDWFHILDLPSTPDIAEWDRLPSRIERNFCELLELFAEKDIRVTCFFLGWVARRHSRLVRRALSYGHEIASHGYAHRLIYRMTEAEFYADARGAKEAIEDAAGQDVLGYRASGFSCTLRTPWFFDVLARAGYTYDSSVFPAPRAHGGMAGSGYAPHLVSTPHGELTEFPISVTTLLHQPVCLFGGGYLRLAPWNLIRRGALQVLAEGRPVIFYVHPREIDPGQPRLPMGCVRRFKSYVNLRTTEVKIRNIMSEFEFCTFRDLLPARVGSRPGGEVTACS